MHRLLVAVLLKLLNTGVAQESAAATTTTAAIATMELSNGISRPVGYDVWPPRNLRIVRNWNSTTVGNEAILQELVEPPVPPYLLLAALGLEGRSGAVPADEEGRGVHPGARERDR